MKSFKNLVLFLLAAMVFVSCGKYENGQSVWAEGSWLVPWLLIIGAAIFGYIGYKRWTSGSVIGGSYNDPTIRDGGGRVPWYKVTQFIWAAILLIVFIIVLIVQNADK